MIIFESHKIIREEPDPKQFAEELINEFKETIKHGLEDRSRLLDLMAISTATKCAFKVRNALGRNDESYVFWDKVIIEIQRIMDKT